RRREQVSCRASEGSWQSTRPPRLGWLIDRLGRYMDIDRADATKFLAERLQTWGSALAASTLIVVGCVVGAVTQMLLVVFTLFYFFRDGERIRKAVTTMLPLQRVQWKEIPARARRALAPPFYAGRAIAAIQGTLGTFIFWALGLPSPLLWGVVMFFLSMIPMAGALAVWMCAARHIAVTAAFVKAGILVLWGILVIGSIDNVLSARPVRPRGPPPAPLLLFCVVCGR